MNTVYRTFMPGSQWFYIKIYSGIKTTETILIKEIYSLIKTAKNHQWIDKWFFIRYADPDPHLRVRFLLKEKQNVNNILSLFHKKLNWAVQKNIIWKVQIDTYNRELERYGNHLIEETESFFWMDSETTLSIIRKIVSFNNENYRWMISLKMIDCLLSDFSLNIMEKHRLMETLSHSFKTEFGFNDYNSKQFNIKFREKKHIIESILNNTVNDQNFVSLYNLLQDRSKSLIPVFELIKMKSKKKNLNMTLNNLLASYIHMMLNRLFRSKSRMHELVLYDIMRRYYTSEIAKLKFNRE
ncbi:thiopeptide-type bacteriocin biosynthesis protein [Parabacteroides chinchillae]